MNNKESYKHKAAKHLLCKWLSPKFEVRIEEAFGYFQPDITIYSGTRLDAFYEVTHKNELTGRKLGLMQYWCYKNFTEFTIHEVSADFILKQTSKPDRIEDMECYIIDVISKP